MFEDKIGPQPYPNNFYITSISEHKEQAFQAISYLTSEEFQMQASKAGRILTTTTSKAVKESFGQDNPMYKGKNVKALQPIQYASAAGFSQKQDINTGLQQATELANKKIDAELAKK